MEFVQIGQYIAAFALVVGLIGLMALAMRKFGNPGMRRRPRSEARLEIVESLPIDARSRLILIRRDDVEHLLVKSGDRVEVVESDIFEEEYIIEDYLDEDDFEDDADDTEPRLNLGSKKEQPEHAA
jgi:flagellar biogenesis protein FliO